MEWKLDTGATKLHSLKECDFLAYAEYRRRQIKFLIKLFIKSLWVKRSEGKTLGPGTPGTITLLYKVYCAILYVEDSPFYIPNWGVFTKVCRMILKLSILSIDKVYI